jgi:hypothetical protein
MPLVTTNHSVGIHAFVVGIDDYRLLPGPGQPPGPAETFGMRKLQTAADGAHRFLQWLLAADGKNSLAGPLASYEVLLAPPAGSTKIPTQYVGNADAANFVTKIREWRERVATDARNIALFYFSGHGIQRTKEDAVLMLQDFGDPNLPILANAISFYEIFTGMAQSPRWPGMATTQFYFIDACRNVPDEVKEFETLQTRPVFDKALSGGDNRVAPIYFAAYNDSEAFGPQFTNSLLDALGRGADGWIIIDNRVRWPVTSLSLITGLTNAFAKLTTTQGFTVGGHQKDGALCYLFDAPIVDLEITVAPESRRQSASVAIQQVDGNFTWELQAPPWEPHPYPVPTPWGTHRLSVNIAGNGSGGDTQLTLGPLPINQKSRRWPVTLP